MMRACRPIVVAVLIAILEIVSAAAGGASTLSYRGKTSQKRRISFSVSSGSVINFRFHIVDTCSRRRILFVWDHGFPVMAISQSKFGGTFTTKARAKVVVDGDVHGKTISGSLSDRTKNKITHKFCSGSATFKLRPT